MQNKWTRYGLFLLSFLIIFQLFKGTPPNPAAQDDIVLTTKSSFVLGNEVIVQVANHTKAPINLENTCPKNPLTIERYVNGEWIVKETTVTADVCATLPVVAIAAGESANVAYGPWNNALFDVAGRYRVSLKMTEAGKEKTYSSEFTVDEPGFIRVGWNAVFYKPIFNTLIYLISVLPNRSLGSAIILLTLLIKLLLLGPNQKALRAQKQMQRIQPELEALKLKHKDNPQVLASETMAVWKKYKVSPMSSCLPLLIQFPILIALFYAVRDGLHMPNPTLLYDNLKSFDFKTINALFLGIIDLSKANKIVLPLMVGGLQFLQMKLALGKAKPAPGADAGMAGMNKMMIYVMPLMIAFFTSSLPAAVGFYWGTSTLFGIAQQIIVNRAKD